MSEPRVRRARRARVALGARVALVALLAAAPALVRAQTRARADDQRPDDARAAVARDRVLADSLTRARVALQIARDSATADVEARQQAVQDRRNQYFTAGQRRVRFSAEEIADADTAAVAAGLRQAEAMLRERLGPAGLGLIDTATWVLSSQRMRGLRGAPGISFVTVQFNEKRYSARRPLRRPIRPAQVAQLAVRLAGEGFAARRPALASFAGIELDLDPLTAELAAREMALSWAAAGRNCAAGALGACVAVLTPRSERDPSPPWFERADARAAVTAAPLPGLPDSAFSAMRRTCLRDDERVCPAVLERLVAPDPFSGNLRGSLASHAIALGGPAALDRLATAPDGAALDILSHVAGVSTDSLVGSWRTRVMAALDASRPSAIPSALAALVWCALFLALAVRRRPA